MMEAETHRTSATSRGDEISLLALGNALLRRRRLIVILGFAGAILGLASGLLRSRLYSSNATFIPQGVEGGASSGLALAASQFGIRIPSAQGGWGPPIYVELLTSQAILEPIALDTLLVTEEGGRRVPVMDLLDVQAPTRAQRIEGTVRKLESVVAATEDKKLNAVRVTVTTRWPSVSFALAQRLVRGVNEFNLKTRKSQAMAEREFVDVQAAEAASALRTAEDRLQSFLQRNRATAGSAELTFERDRLQRDVTLRQQVYSSLLQSREEAKIREVRDTPVITVLEEPRLPITGNPRKSVQKAFFGGIVGGILGVLIALLMHGLGGARQMPSEDSREFFETIDALTPRFLKRNRAAGQQSLPSEVPR